MTLDPAMFDLVHPDLLAPALPSLFAPDAKARRRTVEFFAAHIRNTNTRRAYAQAGADFSRWCRRHGICDVRSVEPVHVAAYIEQLSLAAQTVKQRLAALRALFDWLVVGQVLPANPAASVRGPRHSIKVGKTPVLSAQEVRDLIAGIETDSVIGLRDRAIIGVMTYTFARVGAVTQMQVEDVYVQRRRLWIRLHEKGGKLHEMPCHHNLEDWLHEYLDGAELISGRGMLFRSAKGPTTASLSDRPMSQADVYRMIRRRASAADINTDIGCHSFRATGITEYLRNGGKLEIAQQMANHESARTTGLYDRRGDQIKLDEVERIFI
jgi:site-specific recombinase XerD